MSNEYKLSELPPVQAHRGGRTNLLALSGGGYRGFFSAAVLARLESELGGPVHKCFDLIAGTSIGGIVACALASGIGADVVLKAMVENGETIFGKPGRLRRFARGARSYFTSKYSSAPLESVVRAILGPSNENRLLSNVNFPLLLPTVSYSAAAPMLLRSHGLAGAKASRVTLTDAAMATSAAPTYFPARLVNNELLVDGGLIANAPDAVAVANAMHLLGCVLEDIYVLSIGTSGEPMERPVTGPLNSGKVAWIANHRLVELTLTAQERLAVDEARTLLKTRFTRIDARPSADEQKYLALDRADDVARSTLGTLANRACTLAMESTPQALRDFWTRSQRASEEGGQR